MLLHAQESGRGPTVCLLHGLFGRAQNLGALARRLAASHRVIALDLRNHGASPHAAGMAYATMAEDVFATLAAMAALPCAVLGHSMGGKVAMVMALSQPPLVRRLVVADIAPVAYAHHNAGVAAALQALQLTPGLDRRRADLALAAAVPDPGVRGFLLQNLAFGAVPAWKIGLDAIAAGMAEIEGWPPAMETRHYPGPALFVAGGASDYVTLAGSAAIARQFPAARVQVLPGAGHWLHAEQPEAFAAAVVPFVDEDAP